MLAYYGNRISPHITESPEGFLICHDVPIARTGPQEYRAQELQLDGDPERIITVNRHPEDVFEDATLASFEGKPITEDHPPENVGPENYAAYTKGHVQNVRRQGDYIIADLYINDAQLADEVKNGLKREVSCGYLCNYVPDGENYRQTAIRGNHVAVVPRGRAGHEVAIKDAATQAEKGLKQMKKETKEALYRFFGLAANDAAPEELEQLTKDVSTVADALDAEPAEAPEAKPTEKTEDEMVERAPKGDDLGSKLDRIIAMLEAKSRGGEGEHRLHDESDIDEEIKRLLGKEEEGKSITIPVENDCAAGPARDAAVELLRKVRPAVAAIEDKKARARVTDALLSAISTGDKMTEITRAAMDSARANAQKTAKTTYEQACEESQNAYAARNPHLKKEG